MKPLSIPSYAHSGLLSRRLQTRYPPLSAKTSNIMPGIHQAWLNSPSGSFSALASTANLLPKAAPTSRKKLSKLSVLWWKIT